MNTVRHHHHSLTHSLTHSNAVLKIDPVSQAVTRLGSFPAGGFKWHKVWLFEFLPLVAQAENESLGARREALRAIRLCMSSHYLPLLQNERGAAMLHDFLEKDDCWGAGAVHAMGMHTRKLRTWMRMRIYLQHPHVRMSRARRPGSP